MRERRTNQGFTLLEIVVVLFIIASLTTIATVALNIVKDRARDVRRLNDVKTIRNALTEYKSLTGIYPNSLNLGSDLKTSYGSVVAHNLPQNISYKNGAECAGEGEFEYEVKNAGRGYTLRYCLESKVKNIGPGPCLASPASLCTTP